MPKVCTHKTPQDHTAGFTSGKRRIWRCTNCGKEDTWGPSWGYYGTVECARGGSKMRGCGWPGMEWVSCSAACARVLAS